MKSVKKYVWIFPVDLPGGKFCVVVAHIPISDLATHEKGMPRREYWQSTKLFKLKRNADKYLDKISTEQRNHNLNQTLISKGLFSLN